MTVWNDSH